MSYIVSLTKEAEQDLRGIYLYITFELLSPQNAKGQVNRLQKSIESLSEFPKRHRIMEVEPWKSRGIHVMPCDNFLIFYLVDEKNLSVVVSKILYGKRDIGKILK